MKFAIIKVINGNYFIHAEGIDSIDSAKAQFHGLCQTLWNAPDVISATVIIANEKLDVADGYREVISHAEPVEEIAEE